MSDNTPASKPPSESPDLRAEARRWVRRKRILYTILGIYGALSVMWFSIDMADGTESLWFYWPMLGTGVAVAITAIVLFGIGGLFGVAWEARQVDRYLQQRGGNDQRGRGSRAHPVDDCSGVSPQPARWVTGSDGSASVGALP